MAWTKSKWFTMVKALAPIVLTTVKPQLAPIAGEITDAMEKAEQIPNAKGIEKLQYVKAIATNAASAVNAASGHVVIDTTTLDDAVEHGVSTAVAVANLIHKQ